MQLTVNNILYLDKFSSDASLVSENLPDPNETQIVLSDEQIAAQSYPLSSRNSAGAYLLPVEKDIVYMNYIPMKRMVSDESIRIQLEPEFEFFVDDPIIEPELFSLPDGFIFRCAGEGPKPKEQYTYYIMREGIGSLIPNYQTLEVMLAERGQSLLAVRVIEENQCDEIEKQGIEPDLSSQWTEDFKDQSNPEILKELEGNVKSGSELAESAKAEADKQIAAVKAAEEKAKAEAEAAKAQSEADKAAAEAAIEAAKAAQAAAEAAKAQADLEKSKLQNQ